MLTSGEGFYEEGLLAMSLSCYRCRRSDNDKWYFSVAMDPQRLVRSGLVCPSCHDELNTAGIIIGYLPFNGDGIGWVRSALTLRSLSDSYAAQDFQFGAIRRIAGPIDSRPRRDIRSQLQAVADVYGWISRTHNGPDTYEGWLFHVTSGLLQTMLDDERLSPADPLERRRFHNVLAFHGAIVRAAGKSRRQALIQAIVGMCAATFSAAFRAGVPESHRDPKPASEFLKELIDKPTRPMTAFRTLECLAAGNPWLVFFASQLPNLPAASIKRIAEMLLAAINTPEDFQRREAVLRAIHWEDRFLYRLPEIAPQIINATRLPQKSSSPSDTV